MIQIADSCPAGPDREIELLRVLEDVARRRELGERVDDQFVIASNPSLLPELRERLEALRHAEAVMATAAAAPNTKEPHADLHGVIPGFELREVVGRGAMGVVYRAVPRGSDCEVAIKLMHAGPFIGDRDRLRFEREAHILAQLRHPNIVAIRDTGWAAGRFYLVMDFVSGEPLDSHVKSRSRDTSETVRLFAAVCDAVHAAHLRGVIHRDLKPSNILVDEDGEPHLLDFGLAKLESDELAPIHTLSATMTGQFVGSLPWASPEQAQGATAAIDLRTDIYSLGVMLYQLLTDRFPYPVIGNIRDVVDRILTASPVRPSTINRGVDHDLETITLKCLAKEPERRYQSAGELAADLRRYLSGELIEARRDSGWYLFRRALRQHRAAANVAAAFVVMLLGFSTTMAVLYARAQSESLRARHTLTFLQEVLFQASSQRLGRDATLGEVLDAVSTRLPGEFAAEPDVEAALHFTLGSAYETIWEKQRAIPHLRAALQSFRSLRGNDDEATLRAMVLLGMVLAELNQPEGVAIQREALALRIHKDGPNSRQVADTLGELAYALWAAGDPPAWEEAERTYHEAIALYRQTVGDSDPYFARVLTGFGFMRLAQRRFDEALVIYEEALSMTRAAVGDRHQFAVECQMGLADALAGLGRRSDARAHYEETLRGARKLFGSRAVPAILRKLATFEEMDGNFGTAERIRFEGLAHAVRHAHPADTEPPFGLPSFRDSLIELAECVTDDCVTSRDRTFREAAAELAKISGKPGDAALHLIGLASLRQSQNRHDAAVALFGPGIEFAARGGHALRDVWASARVAQASSLKALGLPGSDDGMPMSDEYP